MSIESVMPSNQLILYCPLLLPPSIIPSIRVFSKESVFHIRWPKYWSFSFSTSPSMNIQDWSPLGWTGWISLQSKGLSRVFSNTTVPKHQFFGTQLSLYPAVEALPEFQRLSLLPESYGKMEVLCPSGNGCICRRNRTKKKGNFASPYANLAYHFLLKFLNPNERSAFMFGKKNSWINIFFPSREAHRNFEVFIKGLIMRRKLFENHIIKYLPNCFNNLTLDSQDSSRIEKNTFFCPIHCPWHITALL